MSGYGADAPGKGEDTKSAERYWREIERYERATQQWRETAEAIERLYLYEDREMAHQGRRFALLWSNIETIRPAIYARLPVVQCSRRYKDQDPVGRTAAEILERAINSTLDLYGAGDQFDLACQDRLVAGRGTVWARYEATIDGDEITHECALVDHVHWRDFGHTIARRWGDVTMVWRRVHMTRSEVKKRFPDVAERLEYGDSGDTRYGTGGGQSEPQTACIYEVWDKLRRRVVHISRSYPDIIEDGPPPINFRKFWPCPMPLLATHSTRSLIPRPDYVFYRDQAKEINDLTDKIANLTDWLVLKGFIPGGPSSEGADAVERLIRENSNKSVLVPVESWMGFTDKGGAAQIQWMPLDVVLAGLQGMIQARSQLIQDVYQITGISDILRGDTDPNETLGAQNLKAQTSARRVKVARDGMARLCREAAELVGEIIAEIFSPKTIAEMTGYKYVPGVAEMQQPRAAVIAPDQMPNLALGEVPKAVPVQMPGQAFEQAASQMPEIFG